MVRVEKKAQAESSSAHTTVAQSSHAASASPSTHRSTQTSNAASLATSSCGMSACPGGQEGAHAPVGRAPAGQKSWRQAKADLQTGKRDVRTRHIPVHVVSVDDDSQAALSSGAIGYLFKPVKREQLVDMLEELELGLRPVKAFEVDLTFFEGFSS